MQKIYSSRSRLERVAWDIIQDFDLKPRLMDGKEMQFLVASIYSACKYYEFFSSVGLRNAQSFHHIHHRQETLEQIL